MTRAGAHTGLQRLCAVWSCSSSGPADHHNTAAPWPASQPSHSALWPGRLAGWRTTGLTSGSSCWTCLTVLCRRGKTTLSTLSWAADRTIGWRVLRGQLLVWILRPRDCGGVAWADMQQCRYYSADCCLQPHWTNAQPRFTSSPCSLSFQDISDWLSQQGHHLVLRGLHWNNWIAIAT